MRIALRKPKRIQGRWMVGDLSVIVLCLLIIISLSPIFSRNVPNIVFYGLVFILFALNLGFYVKIPKHKGKIMVFLFFYLGVLTIYKVLNISSANISYYSTTVKSLIFMVIMVGIGDKLRDDQKKVILAVIVLSVCVTLADNMRLYYQYGAYRFVSLFQTERFSTNSVNTAYVYALLFFAGILFVVFLKSKNKLIKFVSLFLTILSILFSIVIAQRTTAIVLSVILFPLLLMTNAKRSATVVLFSIITILILVFAFLFLDQILEWLASIITSPRIVLRINQIRTYFQTMDLMESGGSLSGRLNLTMQSVNTAFSSLGNFILGVGDHRSNYRLIGNHSHFIDEFARYGLVGMLIWAPMVYLMLKEIPVCAGLNRKTSLRHQAGVLLFLYVIRGFVGSVFESSISVQMFIFMPIVFSFLNQSSITPEA